MPDDNNNKDSDDKSLWEKAGEIGKIDWEKRLRPMNKLWDTVSGFFEAGFQKVWSGYLIIVNKAAMSFWKWFNDTWLNIGDTTIDGMLDNWKYVGWLDEDSVKDLQGLKRFPFPLNAFFGLFALITIHTYHMKTTLAAITSDVRRHLNSKYRSEDAQPREMIPGAFIAPEKTQVVWKILSEAGFPDEQIELLFLSMYKMYDENVIRELYLRGVLDESKMFERMRENGYTDTRIKEIVQSWPIIPGPSDLFHLVAKEAFEPDIVQYYGYDEEFPMDQLKWLSMQGVSEDWARKYWYAHWDTPSIQQGFEMLHRGVIDNRELDDLFRTIEIPPFWRDKLTKIAFTPFTRVDARRMQKTGTLNVEQLKTAYMDVGFDDWHAQKMTEFTLEFNADKEKNLTRGQIVDGFDEYILSFDEAKALLMDLKYSATHAEFLLTFADYERTKKLQKTIIKTVKKRFMLSLISESQTKDELNKLDMAGEKVEVFINQWKLDKFDNLKLPSKTDLDAFFTNKIIDEQTYRVEMFKIGYTDKYIDWYIKAKGKDRPNA